ncbi:hypothetical protein [Microbacterium sp. MYb66]|uniref:hypothetical protein n=1 Tax=Microbacterium sp. MYb66 TaxID=1848692 RepID=UPI000D0061EB|nr:hypothetical protein [Microbacterium sp. MYb66]PRA82031.1 hypothetical protein CQ045_04850 [Microbacterium sp. MYb66]
MKARLLTGAASVGLIALLTACGAASPETDAGTGKGTPTPESSASVEVTDGRSPSPTPSAIALPTDCRAILSDDVLAQLDGVPLNDAAFGPSGVGEDGTLTCNWADPGADTTRLTTTISTMNRGPALDMLNALADEEGFASFTPDGGTRCEKTWANEQYPVTDGRTLFWRDDILIDTRYSNLAPDGYTSSIVEHIYD